MQPKVSVLMPSRNVYQYIEGCLGSVVHQSLQDIEIICIDADSTDGTLDVLMRYAVQDDRIHIISSHKASYGSQMNQGLRQAQGEYIAIVETDDYIEPDMLKKLYDSAKERDLDVVKGDFTAFTHVRGHRFAVPKKLSQVPSDYGKTFNPMDSLTPFGWEMYTWTGLYRRQMLMNHNICWHDTPGASFQDIGFWFQTFVAARRVGLVNVPVYCYCRDNPQASVSGQGHLAVGVDEFRWIKKLYKHVPNLWHQVWPAFANELIRFSVMAYPRLPDEKKVIYAQSVHELLAGPELDERGQALFAPYNYNVFQLLRKSAEEFVASYHDGRINLPKRQQELAADLKNFPVTVIFSSGSHGVNLQLMLYENFDIEIVAFADNDRRKCGTECNGVCVLSAEQAVAQYPGAYFLIANKLHGDEIAAQLLQMGVLKKQMQIVPVEKLLDVFL